eukprot:TRINITY_DN38_c0_g1_i1.p1 TRINITY_DN38_c0_g1~~TRINITY_DN38_c0_g1_i1.p1  ORF type:complete len:193 (+),score=35.26 TRINITY_DN38_c0_g1_i1:155-733(+)
MCIRDRYQRRVRGSARPVAMGCTTSKDPPESLHKMAKELYHLIDKDSDKKLTIDEIVAWLSNNKKHASDTDMDAFAKEIYAIAKVTSLISDAACRDFPGTAAAGDGSQRGQHSQRGGVQQLLLEMLGEERRRQHVVEYLDHRDRKADTSRGATSCCWGGRRCGPCEQVDNYRYVDTSACFELVLNLVDVCNA